MKQESIERTEELAPILRMMSAANPDYKSLSLRLLTYLGFEELGYVLSGRRQEWNKIYDALVLALEADPAWIRVQTVLDALTDEPQDLDQLARLCDLARMTISQTINALDRGGYTIPYERSGDNEGRPKKAFYLRARKKKSSVS